MIHISSFFYDEKRFCANLFSDYVDFFRPVLPAVHNVVAFFSTNVD